MSLMMITHDLGVIGEVTDHVAVMYGGKIVEKASTKDLFNDPLHPYTQGLFKSRPEIKISGRLESIKGAVPSPYEVTEGCSFAPRCDFVSAFTIRYSRGGSVGPPRSRQLADLGGQPLVEPAPAAPVTAPASAPL